MTSSWNWSGVPLLLITCCDTSNGQQPIALEYHRYSIPHNIDILYYVTGIGIIYYCVHCGIMTMHALHIKYAYDVTSCVTMYVIILKRPRKVSCEFPFAAKRQDTVLWHTAHHAIHHAIQHRPKQVMKMPPKL